ncbi:mitochondrial carrier domain-containing protein [Naematelia encephala]|uniref:Mitochondrial carrier domain-containing protein n=1 Tax=Naematelia encephala TaxID=71784 RepID=A0A1Y2AWJ1_9TREE|nr:mitochondrial carrier domain-containing protein [Naematelia encephala]
MGNNGTSGSNGSSAVSPAIDFTAGVIAGAAGLIVGQPFDVVKVRYQTPQFQGRYTSTFAAIGSIVKEEGTRGLFKGVMSPMAGIAFINGVVFTSYSFFMKLQHPSAYTSEPHLGQICLAGAGSGVLSAFITCPTELIKIRQQSAPPHLNLSTVSVCRSVIAADGLRGLYRGFSATALRDLAYGPYFCTYEAMCRLFKYLKPPPPPPPTPQALRHHHESLMEEADREVSELTWGELMAAGGVAGVTAWIATFPLDVFKTRMQSIPWPSTETQSPSRPSLWYTARHAIHNEGWRVMFAGLGPTLIRAVPVNMVVFVTFEACVMGMSR